MAFVRGRLGLEYNTTPTDRDDGFHTGPIVAVIAAIVFVLLTINTINRFRNREMPREGLESAASTPVVAPVQPVKAEPTPPPEPVLERSDALRRPPRLRQLIDRLDTAERANDIQLAISAIEEIRVYPGGAAADLEDSLSRRLGELNLKWLWELKNAKWVTDVTIKRGDNATRIAREHGSTLASMRKLNPTIDLNLLKTGTKVKVMHLPRFILVVHLRLKTADLQLNGKFFKRYDLSGNGDAIKPGSYETTAPLSAFLAEHQLQFSSADLAELDMLVPKASTLVISEM